MSFNVLCYDSEYWEGNSQGQVELGGVMVTELIHNREVADLTPSHLLSCNNSGQVVHITCLCHQVLKGFFDTVQLGISELSSERSVGK